MKKIVADGTKDKGPKSSDLNTYSLEYNNTKTLSENYSIERQRNKSEESITLLLGITIYALWLIVTASFNSIPWPVALLLGGLVICWHGSFQHEAIHGHPFKSSFLNTVLAYPPLGLVIPYPIYKEHHTKHHQTGKITDPYEDPESFYYSNCNWKRNGKLVKSILTFNNTIIGRLTVGPSISTVLFLHSEITILVKGDRSHLKHWALHLISIAALAVWIVTICGINPFYYLVFFVYPGIALTLLRSFAEHRPASVHEEKSAIIESIAPMQLLYLNNNFHFIHHKLPWLPWYKIPFAYTNHKNEILESNDGYFFKGYNDLFKLYLLDPKDSPLHPQYKLPEQSSF